jgi:glycosyltransferase involved in cell wall biosynthesis/SAM-dependent methyltransferase
MRVRVLTFVNRYLPGYKAGGAIRSVSNLVETLGGEFEFSVVTSDRDSGDGAPYAGICVDGWNQVGKARVFYLPEGKPFFAEVGRLMRTTPHDVIYLNSFFSPGYTQAVLWQRLLRGRRYCRPVVLAPRGELHPGALSIKAFKKWVYIALSKKLGVYDRLTWQASSADEVKEIELLFGRERQIEIAPDLSVPADEYPPFGARWEKSANFLRVAWISRIARKKNLTGALAIALRSKVDVEFDIYGPMEDSAYWAECEELIRKAGPTKRIHYRGLLAHRDVRGMFEEHDIFLFPTWGENFGHVILEALMAGCPVLTSDQTPWHDLEQAGAGWEVPLGEPARAAAILDAVAGLEGPALYEMRRRAHAYGERIARAEEAVELNRQLFLQIVVGDRQTTDSGSAVTLRSHFDAMAGGWNEKYGKGGSLEYRLSIFAGTMLERLGREGRVLDFGCGTGDLTLQFARSGLAMTGIDCSPEMVRVARQRVAGVGIRFDLMEGGRASLPYEAAAFDGVLASSVLEYLDDPLFSLCELRRVTRPGGVLLATVPNPWHVVRWEEALERRARKLAGRASGKGLSRRGEYLALSKNRGSFDTWRWVLEESGWKVQAVRRRVQPLSMLIAEAV